MGLLLLTPKTTPGSRRAGRESLPTSWLEVALRWIDERLGELGQGEPAVDYVRLGQAVPEGSAAYAMMTRLAVRPMVRNRLDGTSDHANVQLGVTCMAGMDLMDADPFAASRVAGRVWALLDEWHRTDVAIVAPGEARSITIRLNRANVEDADPGEQMALRLPSITIDAGIVQSSGV